ncbi:MAG: UDP-N-acetylmuramoyl-tripeptide--D-alanyl-D-alanine ligase [Saccharofermentans sp.]|nr:UDP-N-acetylmuramoyl-tripeptide--D-alanyl-D-alanine ligase [Saccharofermentans sp.]
MAKFTLDEIKNVIGGNRIAKTEEKIYDTAVEITDVSTDTRTIAKGDIFFALTGENFNGNEYAAKAIELGASAVVVTDAGYIPEGGIGIVVPDTKTALTDLANHYRVRLGASGCKVVGITGSVGKTSTRKLIRDVLATGYKVHATTANNNNEIGMSKAILSAPSDTEILVLEMGMRALGEISFLTKIALPDFAVITNTGYSHIGILGSRENIIKAKFEITEGLADGGVLAVNGDDPMLYEYASTKVPFGKMVTGVAVKPGEDICTSCPMFIRAANIESAKDSVSFDSVIETSEVTREFITGLKISQHGDAPIRNVLFALYLAYSFNLGRTEESKEAIRKVVSDFSAGAGRGLVTKTSKYLIVNDAYNASPESMALAFENFRYQSEGSRAVLALGGILELGDYAPVLHEMVGKNCAKYGFDRVFVTGDNADDFIKGAHSIDMRLEIIKCSDTEDMRRRLEEYVKPGDSILFKASHYFKLEELAKYFIEKGNEVK